MARNKPITLPVLWEIPGMIRRLSETERFALPGVSVGMRCNIAQYKLLRALDGKQAIDWQKCRRELETGDPSGEIWLQGADIHEAYLEGADLGEAHLEGARLTLAHLEGADLRDAHLKGAKLDEGHLEGAGLHQAHLEGADLWGARLEGAELRGAHLDEADLRFTHLEGAKLILAHLEGAKLRGAHMANANLHGAHLEKARLSEADVRGASLTDVYLQGADLSYLGTDGMTLIYPMNDGQHYAVDRETYASGVALANIRISPGVRQLLEYNVRRHRWLRWCGSAGKRGRHGVSQGARWEHWAYRWSVWVFWQMSDYGRSTGRIGLWFLGFSVAFAAVYFLCGLILPPGIVDGLFIYESAGQVHTIGNHWLIAWRALYFSVVTMTTLGFGDIAAYPLSWAGHGLLMLQVILGYVLLGALVCRLAILFQAGGPAGKFSKPPKPEPEETEEADE